MTSKRNQQADYHDLWCSCYHFYEVYGFRHKKIKAIFDKSEDLWDEIGPSEDSAISQLYDETGVILGAQGIDKDFFDLVYLNPSRYQEISKFSRAQVIRMLQQQKKWTASLVTATILLAMRRNYGWGQMKLERLVGDINEVKLRYDLDEKAIKAAAEEMTKVAIALHD